MCSSNLQFIAFDGSQKKKHQTDSLSACARNEFTVGYTVWASHDDGSCMHKEVLQSYLIRFASNAYRILDHRLMCSVFIYAKAFLRTSIKQQNRNYHPRQHEANISCQAKSTRNMFANWTRWFIWACPQLSTNSGPRVASRCVWSNFMYLK